MNDNYYVKSIIEGSEVYFRAFALAKNMYYESGDIEWISPIDGNGPRLVFKVELDENTAIDRMHTLVREMKDNKVPSKWVITPSSMPLNIKELLLSNGFKDLSSRDDPEFGMAMNIQNHNILKTESQFEIKKIGSMSEFKIWMDVVNEALHGWPLLTLDNYSSWLNHKEFSFYLAYHNQIPVSTLATFQYKDNASIEFMSTLEQYRNQGIGTAIIMNALQDLQSNGIKIATLRSFSEANSFYKKIGFKPYYEQLIFLFQNN